MIDILRQLSEPSRDRKILSSRKRKSCLLCENIKHNWGKKCLAVCIGVGRFRICGGGGGGGGGGGQGGPNFQQAHGVVMTSMRRNDVASTSFRRHVPTRFLINQCQIITILILKSDIENSRIEFRGIVLPVPSNQIKGTFIIILPFNLVHLWFFPVSHRNWRKRRVNYWGVGGWGGGANDMLAPPLPNYWGPSPLPPSSSYAYGLFFFLNTHERTKAQNLVNSTWIILTIFTWIIRTDTAMIYVNNKIYNCSCFFFSNWLDVAN